MLPDIENQTTERAVSFKLSETIHSLKHYLPAQAPLKDFIHHNTLHAFQHLNFIDGISRASEIFGYKVTLGIEEYRNLYQSKRINHNVLEKIIRSKKGEENLIKWLNKCITKPYKTSNTARIGKLRANWKLFYKIDLDSLVHPILFRIICSYLDQGISIWNFPIQGIGFIDSIKALEKNSFTSFFKTKLAKELLLSTNCSIPELLNKLVGNESLYEQYLFDQQFEHQGWSGMVSAIENQPETLLDTKKISLHDFILFELLLEIDNLTFLLGNDWNCLSKITSELPDSLFKPSVKTELVEVSEIWQEAFEWTYYDQVLAGIKSSNTENTTHVKDATFQALFCIDDRECSFRRYLENFDTSCETFGTPGFFSVDFFFKPEHGKFHTKLCPAPITPKHLIKELETNKQLEEDVHFTKHSHKLFHGWLISQSLGFWSAFKLFLNIFKPSISPATASSFKHMEQISTLTIENKSITDIEDGLQIGFTIDEMTDRVERLLRSIGLVNNFAPIVYIVGHGASSVNNPHYAAYDCGACSGRPGSVNARIICHMANHTEVRKTLEQKGVVIPETCQFIGGIHDTTRDEIIFFDESSLSIKNKELHLKNKNTFNKALDFNARERSRRFELLDTSLSEKVIHEKIKIRSVSLFEPRPELNHATNALCIVGRRALTKQLFLDRRSFLNSYDYRIDPEGNYLLGILNAAAPVCGGINLEYYFSRVDNQKLGAGTKLPHNVMGLFGVANGIDGDLRPGLPSQMIEVHDPIRLLIIVEHFPDVILNTIKKSESTYEWFINKWIHLVAINPDTKEQFVFKNGTFTSYQLTGEKIKSVRDITPLLASNQENFPVYQIN
ncbi:MAG: DUF2309 domain-containing protein [Bacteroidetes bacterium]|nr:DUF2309 domain-containing protein [Bacteroidota bacterium]